MAITLHGHIYLLALFLGITMDAEAVNAGHGMVARWRLVAAGTGKTDMMV